MRADQDTKRPKWRRWRTMASPAPLAPVHTPADGDTAFVVATGALGRRADLLVIGALAADVTARAIVDAARSATSCPACRRPATCRAGHDAVCSTLLGALRRPSRSAWACGWPGAFARRQTSSSPAGACPRPWCLRPSSRPTSARARRLAPPASAIPSVSAGGGGTRRRDSDRSFSRCGRDRSCGGLPATAAFLHARRFPRMAVQPDDARGVERHDLGSLAVDSRGPAARGLVDPPGRRGIAAVGRGGHCCQLSSRSISWRGACSPRRGSTWCSSPSSSLASRSPFPCTLAPPAAGPGCGSPLICLRRSCRRSAATVPRSGCCRCSRRRSSCRPAWCRRRMAPSTHRSVRVGVGASRWLLILFAIVPVGLGMAARVLHPHLASADQALPTLLAQNLPPWVGALTLAGVFGAELSAADAVLFMLSTSLSQDIYRRFLSPDADDRRVLTVARASAVVAAAAGLAMAMTVTDCRGCAQDLLQPADRRTRRTGHRRPVLASTRRAERADGDARRSDDDDGGGAGGAGRPAWPGGPRLPRGCWSASLAFLVTSSMAPVR